MNQTFLENSTPSGGQPYEEDDGSDARAVDPEVPAPNGVLHYLVRAVNACPAGDGSLGVGSGGAPRAGRPCP